jgi:hypothetical protein
MTERDRRRDSARIALIASDPRCTYCGEAGAHPVYGLARIFVCERCLRVACRELLLELNR